MKTSFCIYFLMICFVAMPIWCDKGKNTIGRRLGKPLQCVGCKKCCQSIDGPHQKQVVPIKCDACSKLTSGFEDISGRMKQIFSKVSDCVSVPRAPWLTKTEESSGSIVVSWSTGDGQVDQYVVSAQTTSGNGITKTIDAPAENATLLENLIKGETYNVNVKAISNGVTSVAVTTKTVTLAPSPPTLTKVEESSGTIVTKWTPPGDGLCDQYEVSAQPENGSAVTQTVDAPAENTTLSENLVKGQTYTVSLKAISNGVTSATGTTKTVTLAPSAPTLTKVEESSDTIVTNWTPPGDGLFDQYEVSAQPENGNAITKTVDAPAETATLSEQLLKGETYTVSVKAISNGVASATGAKQTVTLAEECPSDWLPYERSCYFVQKKEVPELSKKNAMERCKSHDSRSSLMIIESFDEFTFMKIYLNSIFPAIHKVTSRYWLIAGEEENGKVAWTPMGPLTSSPAFIWAEGEPDHQYERCLTFSGYSDFDISDETCEGYARQYICEM